MAVRNTFSVLGLSLALAGVLLAVLSFVVLGSTPLTALGVSTVVLGAVSWSLGRGQPRISAEASAILLQSGVENISAIVEELGLKSKAVYLPSSMASGRPQALIPLRSEPFFSLGGKRLPRRLIVRHGPNADDMGLLITTPGSAVSGLVSAKVDAGADDLEAAVSLVLAGTVNLADGARVTMENGSVRVEVSNPRLEFQKMWVYDSLGSPLASMVATVVAEVLNEPVVVEGEKFGAGKFVVQLKLMGRSL